MATSLSPLFGKARPSISAAITTRHSARSAPPAMASAARSPQVGRRMAAVPTMMHANAALFDDLFETAPQHGAGFLDIVARLGMEIDVEAARRYLVEVEIQAQIEMGGNRDGHRLNTPLLAQTMGTGAERKNCHSS